MKRNIVLDTNCLLVSLPKASPYRNVWDSFIKGEYLLCVSNEILNEYQEILAQKTTAYVASNVIDTIIRSPFTRFFSPEYRFNLITDTDDNKFTDCAIQAGADYIVSNDHHFDILKSIEFPKVNVINIDLFSNILSNEI